MIIEESDDVKIQRVSEYFGGVFCSSGFSVTTGRLYTYLYSLHHNRLEFLWGPYKHLLLVVEPNYVRVCRPLKMSVLVHFLDFFKSLYPCAKVVVDCSMTAKDLGVLGGRYG